MSICANLSLHGASYSVQLDHPISLAIPLRFDGPQPNAFSLPRAHAQAFQAGEFVADTRQGGSVNCATLTLTPHGNGTHTECVGHISLERVSIAQVHPGGLFSAALVTVPHSEYGAASGGYPAGRPDDLVVHADALDAALDRVPGARDAQAIILRSAPTSASSEHLNWSGLTPPYLSALAAQSLATGAWLHLITELPSVDRADDEGALLNHRTWWGLPAHRQAGPSPSRRTITEMALVPKTLADGLYALSLDIPAFELDAAPSRPLLYPLVATG